MFSFICGSSGNSPEVVRNVYDYAENFPEVEENVSGSSENSPEVTENVPDNSSEDAANFYLQFESNMVRKYRLYFRNQIGEPMHQISFKFGSTKLKKYFGEPKGLHFRL